MTSKPSALVALARPFTLLAPAMGMLAYGLAAAGASGAFHVTASDARNIAIGAFVAALLNVASNAVNQIYDVEVDRINKPDRPLPSGALTIKDAWIVTVVGYAASVAMAWLIHPTLAAIVAFTAFLTYAYSGPPLRTKRHWAFANLTIATPRGFLLPLAGWLAVSLPRGESLPLDAWILAAASGLFVLGAATTKDYADMEGDRAGGCITLPLRFGVERSVNIVAPFLVLPWLALGFATTRGFLGGNHFVLFWGSFVLAIFGMRTVRLLMRDPAALTGKSTHPSWVLMYLMMVLSQIVAALAYALPPDLLAKAAPVTREDGRQFVHLGTTAFAIPLLWLPLWVGYAACGAAIAFWWIVVPMMKRDVGFTRPGEPFVNGLRTYPVGVLLLLLFFRHPAAHPLATPVAAWAVLGVGDSFSNLVGRPWGTHGFVGREDRSMLGTFAFVVTAWPAAWALATFVGGMSAADAWMPALVAAVAGAVAELIPLPFRLDDNLPVALAAGAAFLATS